MRRREFPVITRLTSVSRLLIVLRITQGLTQRELVERLGMSESLVARDERNGYHDATVEGGLEAGQASQSRPLDPGAVA